MRALVILVLAAAGCGAPPLANTQPSPDALAREVLAALRQRDETRLRALALDEQEFRRRIWPGLPAARPERNLSASYVWRDLRQKSDARLRRTIGIHGGTMYKLQSVKFEGPTTRYGSFRVHRDAVLVVHDRAGQRQEIRVLGSMLEQEGKWKVFSYIDND